MFDLENGGEGKIDEMGGKSWGGGGEAESRVALVLLPTWFPGRNPPSGLFYASMGQAYQWPEERGTSLSFRWITQNIPYTPIEEG